MVGQASGAIGPRTRRWNFRVSGPILVKEITYVPEKAMSSSPLEELEAAALALPRADRARLAKHLIESLDEENEVEEAWEVEVRQRLQAYRGNEVSTEDGQHVFDEVKKSLKR